MCAMTAPTATASLMSPIGLIVLSAQGGELVSVQIDPTGSLEEIPATTPLLHEATRQMRAYFAQECQGFDLPLRPLPTERGEALRAAIASVPCGETLSYGALANQIASAPRAVGQACKRNPFPIIIPCHRITSASGPEHYSGGAGVKTKAWLLDFEQAALPQQQRTRLL
jgi:methylated-DNA-[protein]-cysteine S-methyltransferase